MLCQLPSDIIVVDLIVNS